MGSGQRPEFCRPSEGQQEVFGRHLLSDLPLQPLLTLVVLAMRAMATSRRNAGSAWSAGKRCTAPASSGWRGCGIASSPPGPAGAQAGIGPGRVPASPLRRTRPFHQGDSFRPTASGCPPCRTIANENEPSRRLVAYLELLHAIRSKSMGNVKSIEKAVELLPPTLRHCRWIDQISLVEFFHIGSVGAEEQTALLKFSHHGEAFSFISCWTLPSEETSA